MIEGPKGQAAKNLGEVEAWVNIDIMHPSNHSHIPLIFSNTVDTFTPLVGTVGTTDEGGGGTYEGGAEGPASGVNCRDPCCWAASWAAYCS
jgi:hypothetical protein